MIDMFKEHHPKRHAKSFKYAFEGIFHVLINEPNFRIHIFATAIGVVLGLYLNISPLEWAVITLITAMVLTAEMINTVVENLMDHMFADYSDVAKVIKDLGAGYVLVNAIAALLIFIFIFLPKIVVLLEQYYYY